MIDYKVLAALKLALTALRPKFGDVGSRDVEVAAQQDAIDRALALIEDEFGTVRKTERPNGFYDICTIVNSDFAIQSLLYDVNLLPEQTMHDPTRWRMTTLIACHWAAAFGKPKSDGGGFLTDEWIDDVLKRGDREPREEDRAAARILAVAIYNRMRNTTGLATSDPEAHQQAITDHEADAQPAVEPVPVGQVNHMEKGVPAVRWFPSAKSVRTGDLIYTNPQAEPAPEVRVQSAADLKRFLDGAAGDGLVCGGVDAADLYCALFGAPQAPEKGA